MPCLSQPCDEHHHTYSAHRPRDQSLVTMLLVLNSLALGPGGTACASHSPRFHYLGSSQCNFMCPTVKSVGWHERKKHTMPSSKVVCLMQAASQNSKSIACSAAEQVLSVAILESALRLCSAVPYWIRMPARAASKAAGHFRADSMVPEMLSHPVLIVLISGGPGAPEFPIPSHNVCRSAIIFRGRSLALSSQRQLRKNVCACSGNGRLYPVSP